MIWRVLYEACKKGVVQLVAPSMLPFLIGMIKWQQHATVKWPKKQMHCEEQGIYLSQALELRSYGCGLVPQISKYKEQPSSLSDWYDGVCAMTHRLCTMKLRTVDGNALHGGARFSL